MMNVKVEPQNAQSSMMLNLSAKSKGFLWKCRVHCTRKRKVWKKSQGNFLLILQTNRCAWIEHWKLTIAF